MSEVPQSQATNGRVTLAGRIEAVSTKYISRPTCLQLPMLPGMLLSQRQHQSNPEDNGKVPLLEIIRCRAKLARPRTENRETIYYEEKPNRYPHLQASWARLVQLAFAPANRMVWRSQQTG